MAKKRRTLGDEFSDIEEDFERMREEMEGLMEEMMGRMPEEEMERLAKQNKPGVYGFSVTVNNEGKPVVREFGNMRPEPGEEKTLISEEREPLVDVIDGKESMTVMVELPGVERKEIRAWGEGRNLVISVAAEARKYYKELELPANADFETAFAKYNNGVLELILQKHAKGTANKNIRIN
ncbi:Small heat shock protein HSP16.5 [uncultured archaeon]|nr:Small heat shock protein HSP16.5 [uncultured archaeon]